VQRSGITRDSITIGTVIVVAGCKAKDGRLRANGRDITIPDGRTLFMGSSGTGAPRDGRDTSALRRSRETEAIDVRSGWRQEPKKKGTVPFLPHGNPDAQLMEDERVEFAEELMYGHLRRKPAAR
jgi:hypothetical protein